ncbi:MAG: GH3 auxin-responsive promoter family protein [Paludibacteraceae bacterium]|nr:GH3 auxin-responsive promoter family protein [Paludibacteraceae bacterium]
MLIPNLLLGIAGGIEYLRLRFYSRRPRTTQARTLRAILRYAQASEFGREHHFSDILQAKDDETLFRLYRHYLSPAEYEDFRPYVNRMKEGKRDVLFRGSPLLYATTSGATGEPKWIPISQKYLSDIYGKMNKCWLFNFLHLRRRVYSGSIVSVVGKQIEGYTPDGTIYGSVSGFTQARCPRFVKRLYASPAEVFAIDDYTARNYAIMRMGIERNVTLVVTANPSTMVEIQHTVDTWYDEFINDIEHGTMSEKVAIPDYIRTAIQPYLKPNPKRANELRQLKARYGQVLPKHYWRNLQVLTTWKCGNTQVYLKHLEGAFPENMLWQEFAYFASECRAGLVLDDSNETCLFPHFHFYEFKRADEQNDPDARFYLLDELVAGERYCPYVTTFSGLYRYNMNDIVEVSAPLFGSTPRLHMVQKCNGIVTITGEKLYEGQFIEAVRQTEQAMHMPLNGFIGFANLEESRYDWYFEFATVLSQEDTDRFGEEVDKRLKTLNIEYAAKRDSFRLKAQQCYRLQPNALNRWKEAIVNTTRQDASRFKPNILSQNEQQHTIIQQFVQ